MQIVYRAENIVDAHLIKDALAQEGIFAFISGEYLIGGMGQLPTRDFIAVIVADINEERAQPIVQRMNAQLRASIAASDIDDNDLPCPFSP